MEPYYAEAERLIGVAGDHTGNPFAAWRSGPVPDAAGRRHVPHHPHRAGGGATRVPPVPRADRRQQRPVRRSARVQQLRVLRVLRLPDRRQGRPGGDAAPLAASAGAARSAPRASRWRSLLDASGRRAERRALPRRRRRRARRDRRRGRRRVRRVRDAPAPVAQRHRQLVGPRRPLPDVPPADDRARVLPVPAARVQGSRRHAPHGRPDRRRRRRPRRRHAPPALPYLRGGIVEHGGSGHPIMEAMHLPAGRAAHARSWPTRRCATRWSRSPCRARTCRRPRTGSTSTPGVRDVWGLPAGRVTYSAARARRRVRAPLGAAARSGDARRGRAGHVVGHVAGHAGHRRPAPRADVEALDGHRRAWATTRATSVCDPWQRLWDVDNVRRHRLVGVPDVDGLRPDAHPGRARGASGACAGGIDCDRGLRRRRRAVRRARRVAPRRRRGRALDPRARLAVRRAAARLAPRRRRAAGRGAGARPRVAGAHAGRMDAAPRRHPRRRRPHAGARRCSATGWPRWSAVTSRPSATSSPPTRRTPRCSRRAARSRSGSRVA